MGKVCVFTAYGYTLRKVTAGCKLEQRWMAVLSWQLNKQLKDYLGAVAALSTSSPLAPYSPSFLRAAWQLMTKGLKLHRRHY